MLDTLLGAFDALNSASINQEQDLPPLDQSLRDAIQRYDTRSQLDIYDKLAKGEPQYHRVFIPRYKAKQNIVVLQLRGLGNRSLRPRQD